MEHSIQKHLVLKILLALFPAILFLQNYSMMTGGKNSGWAFLIIWGIVIWSASQLIEKNHILERLFRLTEIGAFMLPVSAIVLSLVIGSEAITSTSSSVEQAGAAIGTAIGGTFITGLSFMIGITVGIIFHIIANKYEKKAEASSTKQPEALPNKHGVVLSLVGVIVLAIILGSMSSNKNVDLDRELKSGRDSETTATLTSTDKSQKVDLEITKKGFESADYMNIMRDSISMEIKFTNKTDKDIKGVQGVIIFYDIFDKKIQGVNISYDKGVPKNGNKLYNASLDYNEFIDENIKLRMTDLKNLKYAWELKTIIYDDGTKEAY